MEASEMSVHEARLYVALQRRKQEWATAKDLAADSQIAYRTARAHLGKLAKLNIVDTAELYPGHRYRLSDKASKRNAGYVTRLERAVEIFGLMEKAP